MKLSIVLIALLLIANSGHATTWLVGPTRSLTAPSQVMSRVSNGDTVEIDSGLYSGDVGTWRASNLILRCTLGMAHLDAAGQSAQKKGIWVLDGNNTYVEGIEFSGCAISESDGGNGAGIRLEGLGMECRRCYFHDNQEGILTGNDTNCVVLIEACEFAYNGVETGGAAGFEHNIYVGHSSSCTIKFCYFRGAIVGHEIKSRANRNFILYNHIVDGLTGDGSYSIDLPNGGLSFVIGNAIEKGPKTENSTVIDYGAEGIVNPDSEFYFINNTVVTDRQPTTFLNIKTGATAMLVNNIFAGGTHLMNGTADTVSNII
ncbi:MAG TPA: right-handed parallel beta-helix repeat-containing protein, partial [Candidatus Kapabacteria bacterium]|nr:right-handed parallel beta-helix repeat-containing protein [Candidatus Kapabacteria bacterium]